MDDFPINTSIHRGIFHCHVWLPEGSQWNHHSSRTVAQLKYPSLPPFHMASGWLQMFCHNFEGFALQLEEFMACRRHHQQKRWRLLFGHFPLHCHSQRFVGQVIWNHSYCVSWKKTLFGWFNPKANSSAIFGWFQPCMIYESPNSSTGKTIETIIPKFTVLRWTLQIWVVTNLVTLLINHCKNMQKNMNDRLCKTTLRVDIHNHA